MDKQNRIAALNPETRADRIAELEALILTHQERIEFLTTRNGELAALITAHETRITELTARNTELSERITAYETRITELTDKNTVLMTRVTEHEERSLFLAERNEVLTTQREIFQTELNTLLASGCNEPPVTGSNVTFLHSDHLGRPKFATNADGEVIWNEGITTPFGIQITAMAAQTQALMFPGQYQDLETTGAGVTLSHNWHRTYDPTLGRYLQSDPIGLAGGLNRYAYVGGNPVGYVDFTGLAWQKNGAGYWEQDNKPLSEYNMVEKAQYAHFNRNIFNNAPCFLDDAKGFEELLAADFHQQGIGGEQNRKYINGLSEGIYDANGRRVNDPLNRGTYNYSKPYTPILNPKNFGHLVYDVVPYWLWKNDPDDPTSFVQRLGGTYNGPIPQGGSCECLTNIPA